MSTRARIITLICGLAVFTYLVIDFGVDKILWNVGRTGWWFAPIIGVWAIVYLFNALAWYVILRVHTDKVEFKTIYGLTVSGFGLNYVTPFLNLGGEPYRVLSLRDTIGLHRSVSSVILYNMVRMLSHFFFWLAAVVLAFFLFPVSPGLRAFLSLTFVLVLLLIFFFFSRHKRGIFESLLSWLDKHPSLHVMTSRLERRRDALVKIDGQIKQLYNGHRGSFYKALSLEFLARVVASFEFLFILQAIGFDATFSQALYINAGSSLIINLLFFMPFELGTREGGLYLVVQSIGYAAGIGVYCGLANRIREFFWVMVGLAIILFTGRPRAKGGVLDMVEANGKS
jgi:uncharacterized protein (TIRG00374 family)